MNQIFISHMNADQDVAIKIATGLEDAGYTTWYYERDSVPGPSYLSQISPAIENCQTMLILFSPTSVSSAEVFKEIEQAYLKRKPIIPVLLNISHKELHAYGELSQMLGTATDINVPSNGIDEIFIRRLVSGLAHMGITAANSESGKGKDLSSFDNQSGEKIYRQALVEALSDGSISKEDQFNLDFIARMLQLSEEQITHYMEEVQKNGQKQEPVETKADEKQKNSLPLEESQQTEPEPEPEKESFQISDEQKNIPAPVLSEEILLGKKWKLALENTLTDVLEMSGDGRYFYRIDTEGGMSIYDSAKNLCYQEHFSVPIYRSLALRDGLVLGDWEGHIFVYRYDQLAWTAHLNSPISALDHTGDFLAAGCWNGGLSVRNLQDGKEIFRTDLPDAVSALTIQEKGEVAAGDLAGHLYYFDKQLNTLWEEQFSSAIVQVEVLGQNKDQLLVLLKDDQLINLKLNDHSLYWRHHFEHLSKTGFSSSTSGKQIAFIHDQQFVIFRIGKELKLVSSQDMPEGIKGLFLPMFQDARFIGLQTKEKLQICDLYQSRIYPIHEGELARWCFSENGQQMLLVSDNSLSLYVLTMPDLSLKLSPVSILYKDRFSRLRLLIENHGKRLARKVKVVLDGAVKSNSYEVASDILPGTQFSTEEYSVNAVDVGAIPIKVNISFEDDFGNDYSSTFDCILDVQAQ